MPRRELPSCPEGLFWEIEAGETLYTIAKKNQTSVEAIIAVNPGIDPYNLEIGSFICLPPPGFQPLPPPGIPGAKG